MAEPWIKVEHGTPEKLEVSRMAELMSVRENEVFGALVRLWIWADKNTADGHALSVTAATIDRRADCVGLANAMREVGWLQGRDAALTFPNFARHNGQSSKARAQAADRKDRQRSRSERDSSVTKAGPEKIREEEDKKKDRAAPPHVALPDLPECLATENFVSAWAEYQQYRKARKLATLQPASIKAQWAKMEAWGPEASIAAIRDTIANGWQGIFAPKGTAGPPPPRHAIRRPLTDDELRKEAGL